MSDEVAGFEDEFTSRYHLKLQLCTESNRVAHKIINTVQIAPTNVVDLLLAALLARQVSTFQAFILVARKGLLDQCTILLRTLAEGMFVVGAVRKDATFAKRYIESEEIARKKALQRLVDDSAARGGRPDAGTIALIAELAEKIKDQNIQKLSTEAIAKIAGLEAYYNTLYAHASMAVHVSVRSLDRYLRPGTDGVVEAIDYSPTADGFDMLFDYAISMLLYVLHEVSGHFGIDVQQIEALQAQNRELAGNS